MMVTCLGSGIVHYYGYDAHGNTRFLADTNGILTDTYTYDAYGNTIAQNPSSNTTQNAYLYAGAQFDSDIGLYYLRDRYMNPKTGRFWTMDSMDGDPNDPISFHKYLYTHDNPINGVDPLGLYEIDVHQFLTTFLASAGGVSDSDRIGEASQASDAPGSTKDAMYQGVSHANMALWHFVTPERLDSMRTRMYFNENDPPIIGDYFHALEDTYAHDKGVDSRCGKYYEDVSWIYNIGHGLEGHEPDFTWNYPVKAMQMARNVYFEMVALAKAREDSKPPTPWSSIRKTVHEFVWFTPETWMKQFYIQGVPVKKVRTATFEGYNQKIHKLDPSYSLGDNYALLKTYDV
jgi:RHS repeat-associated protein